MRSKGERALDFLPDTLGICDNKISVLLIDKAGFSRKFKVDREKFQVVGENCFPCQVNPH